MFAFIIQLVIAAVVLYAGNRLRQIYSDAAAEARSRNKTPAAGALLGAWGCTLLGLSIIAYALVFTSVVYVKKDKFATINKIYGKSMPPGRRIATDGELGPQAQVYTQGWHFSFLVSIINEVEYHDVFVVPPLMCATMSAKDGGNPVAPFAPSWKAEEVSKMANDAVYFLTNGGIKGQQSTVLTPGVYILNPYLWETPKLVPGVIIAQGTVGVIKSFIQEDEVNFGTWKRVRNKDGQLSILTKEKLPKEGPKAQLVPVGYVGIWEEPLANGYYFINPDCYLVTPLPVIEMPFEYKGGYTARHTDLDMGPKGEVIQTTTSTVVPVSPGAADSAITTRVQGFEVPVELRAIVQIVPEMAPYVVATLGIDAKNVTMTSELVESRVLTPVLRTTLRNVVGGKQIKVETKELKLDKDNKPFLDPVTSELAVNTRTVMRLPSLRDMAENRELIEQGVETTAREEAAKQGIEVTQVRIAEVSLPAEVTAAWKREEFAIQQAKTLVQEELAQKQRQATENAKATAEKQQILVEAQMLATAAEQKKLARTTEAEGEKAYMLAIAEGQQAQVGVLGQEQTAKLQMFNVVVKEVSTLIKENPTILTEGMRNAGKFVPNIVVNSGNGGAANNDAAALLFGSMMNPDAIKKMERDSAPGEMKIPLAPVRQVSDNQ